MADILDRLKAALADRYTIERELGAGGMATVYLAEDVKHHRKVAVKVLRPELAAVLGAERFLKEIEVTAHLQHPHILPLFDSGEADSFLYYVMPHIEGESLREKLNREKQLAIDDSIEITKGVANALDYAHRQNVIHRDIKPENILIHDGQPVVADFGISLAVTAAGGTRLTETGLSLGTPQYMSPEQATGDREINGRSDIYSLACVLYEMLAGDPPHTGSTVQAVIAKVVTDRPRPITELRDTVPPHISAAVHKALGKLPADRFGHAAEFSDTLSNESFRAFVLSEAAVGRMKLWTPPAALFVLLSTFFAACFAVLLVWTLTRPTEPAVVRRWIERLPPGHQLDVALFQRPFAVSPDGNWLAYVAQHAEGNQLYLRELSEYQAVAIPGAAGAGNPFFSHDGRWLGFFADGKLQKVSVEGGRPVVICDVAAISPGAHWGVSDTILYATVPTGIFRVPAGGGRPELLTSPLSGELLHRWPQLLPGGRTVLLNVGASAALLSLETRHWEVLDELGEALGVRYVPSGNLIFVQGGVLRAAPFDPERLVITGPTIALEDSVAVSADGATALFDVSRTGVFVHVPVSSAEKNLVWVDRAGEVTPLPIEPGSFSRPQLAPDGLQLAVSRFAEHTFGWAIWVYDTHQGRGTRLPLGDQGLEPLWTLDGERITFTMGAPVSNVGWMRADGLGSLDTLSSGDTPQYPHSWHPDGTLALYELTQDGGRDIAVLHVPGDGTTEPLIATPANERSPSFSPDGSWLAYVSDESGRDEIYVQPYPSMERRYVISTQGGRDPVWSSDGSELFFRNGDLLMVSDVVTSPSFSAASPQVVFKGRFDAEPATSGSHSYDISSDGGRFLMVQSEPIVELRVVLNWTAVSETERQP